MEGVIADLHIHSRFSRACSKGLNLESLEKWARIKGLGLLGTGDFTHPVWLKELKDNLEEREGILFSKTGFKFVLSGEISLMYTDNNVGGGRRVHLLLLAPSFEVVDKINSWLDTRGRRDYDGRPIFNVSCEDFSAKMKLIDDKIEIIPAHIWTPWFGVFGSATGYDSLKEAFGSQAGEIHAIETGMSSDPEMNWRLSELNDKTIVSFSDSHSFWPWRLGREATIFKRADSYDEILREIRENDILGTVETDPAYGKYHWDGHRNCGFSCSPQKTRELGGKCPECGQDLVIGVESRVDELANQDVREGKKFYKMLPLHELISFYLKSGLATKRVWDIYNKLIREFGNEFNILLEVDAERLKGLVDARLVDLIMQNREGRIKVKPGYDGVYGAIDDGKEVSGQKTLF